MNIRSRLFLSVALFLAGCASSNASAPSDQWVTWPYTPQIRHGSFIGADDAWLVTENDGELGQTFGQLGPPKYQFRTSCLIEIRDGKKSCQGIVIDFDDAYLKKRISQQQLRIYEAKHGTNLIKLMTWHVSNAGKRLIIKFKDGTGDFGTGNRAEITLYKKSFIVPPKNFPYYAVFVQGTDLN